MEQFWLVTLFHFQPTPTQWAEVEALALNDYGALGIEEFSLTEAEVDDILGSRSYSGGDLPLEVLEEVEAKVLCTPVNYRFFFSSDNEAAEFQKITSTKFLCESQIEKKNSEDWNAEWKKHYSPIRVNEFFEVIPSWETTYISETRKNIYIYPGMGFGTGSHETTFLCLKLLSEKLLDLPIKTVLDFGSGSGILGLSTLKFYPEAQVDFYDIDPEANKNCYHNAEINKLQDLSFRLLLPQFKNKLTPEYDIVFANILESILYDEKDFLVSHLKKNGFMILSGLLNYQAQGIIDSYTEKGMNLLSRIDKGDWSALLLGKTTL